MSLQDLPALNALLNGSSALLLAAGYLFIRSGRVAAHRACMGTAFFLSGAFLASYLIYHYHVGSVRFQGVGAIRKAYFFILVTHTTLAVANLPLILRTLYLALKNRYPEHRRLARWTLPSWLYVSLSGVAVYWMLYRMKP